MRCLLLLVLVATALSGCSGANGPSPLGSLTSATRVPAADEREITAEELRRQRSPAASVLAGLAVERVTGRSPAAPPR
ncbi:MAG: hypothetical protein AB7E70_15475 [Hyphomicrobiaceae bacterium]